MRSRISRAAAGVLVGLLSAGSADCLTGGRAMAQTCSGDCDGNLQVGVAELVRCVRIGIGVGPLDDCSPCDVNANGAVEINELVEGVRVAVGDYVVLQAFGDCLRPCPDSPCSDVRARSNGLVPCGTGAVHVTRCDARGRCAEAGLDVPVDADGRFSTPLCLTGIRRLLFESDQTQYRVLDLGAAAVTATTAAAGRGRAAALDVAITPVSEAAVRILTDNGLARFSQEGIDEVTDVVADALQGIDFAGIPVDTAADLAADTAAADAGVQAAIDRNLAVVLRVDGGEGPPGGSATLSVELSGRAVAATRNDLYFEPAARIAADRTGNPDCSVNPAINKGDSSFGFFPAGCEALDECVGITALIFDEKNVAPIPEDSVLYTCRISIAADAVGTFPITCLDATINPPGGTAVPASCQDGSVRVRP